MRLVDTALRLAMLLNQRGAGHTSLMQEGLNNYRGDVIVVAHTAYAAKDFAHFRRQTRDMYKTNYLGIESLERSYGLRGAVAVDHHAIAGLLEGLVRELSRAEDRAASAERESALVMNIKEAQDLRVELLAEKCANLLRINADLKEALREACAAPAIKDPMLIAAMVKGVAEEGSLRGRYR